MTLTSVGEPDDAKGKTISEIGSMLFTRGVSGTRVVTGRDTKVIEGYTFKGEFRVSFGFLASFWNFLAIYYLEGYLVPEL